MPDLIAAIDASQVIANPFDANEATGCFSFLRSFVRSRQHAAIYALRCAIDVSEVDRGWEGIAVLVRSYPDGSTGKIWHCRGVREREMFS